MTNKSIAIVGGAFDPVHIAHIEMAKYLIDNKKVDEVWIMPSYNSPQKDSKTMAPYYHRINMLNLVFSEFNDIMVSEFEKEYCERINPKIKTYTFDVLESLKNKYKEYNFSFVVGFDSIKNINTWHRYIELLNNYKFLIFDRDDININTDIKKINYIKSIDNLYNVNLKYDYFDIKISNISSTKIRELLKDIVNNEYKLKEYLNKNVLEYIINNKLYGT